MLVTNWPNVHLSESVIILPLFVRTFLLDEKVNLDIIFLKFQHFKDIIF